MNIENKLIITADREDYTVGLKGKLQVNGFYGFGEGWYNNSDVLEFCSKLLSISESMEGEAELLGTQSKVDGSEYLERFCIRAYVLCQSKLNGIIGLHVTLSEYPYNDCRKEEILKVSGELKIVNHYITQFAEDLKNLISGSLNEVCLFGF